MNLIEKEIEVPLSVIDYMASPDLMLEVKLMWAPGREPSGMSGPPENYDPGDGPEIEINEVRRQGDDRPLVDLTEDQLDAIAEWIVLNEPIEWHEADDWPEPDHDPFEDEQLG